MATNLVEKIGQNYLPPCTYRSHSETEWDIATSMCALIAQMMPLYRVKKFVNFCPVTAEKIGLICILFTTWQKTGIFSQISHDILDRFFTIFSPYESTLGADDIALPRFPIFQRTLPWQSIDFGKMS